MTTAHGTVHTPAFMPVGTVGAVKTLSGEDLRRAGVELVLANTYHLYLRPGVGVVRELGGLHAFTGWPGAILTDSGGFQVMSLAAHRRVADRGVEFRSHLDGSLHLFTPEDAIRIQDGLGSDIAMSLDEPVELPSPPEVVESAARRTLAWARRGVEERLRLRDQGRGRMALFGINQGGADLGLRRRCLEELLELPFDGYALGGLWVGEGKELSFEIVAQDAGLVPRERPRYLMGVGDPVDMLRAVSLGVDLFDCVLPTRNARKGTVFTTTGRMVAKNAVYARDPRPLDPECECPTCASVSRAYLRHLFASGETLAMRLASVHAVHFTMNLMRGARRAVLDGRLPEFMAGFLARYESGEHVAPREARIPASAQEDE